ncbi:hypothetical protein GQ55_3G432000 [Panicum hallii var. hallii]|jgi:hypothetical protein|uniref:Bet v I/Major latex protein domain-containing protein n=2 Tax=Panicum hallii TaxID=206008 RepID=A0A2T7EHU9_9POAL|nr:major allergen Dau c 1-like [Panicum hallii]PAN21344.1 hypothetical protein PAHAL_3G458000 [Panicum hallii]PUZ67406.1 hypothetical protein GQ55_3G432000 [Panicum hallii var. hallii]
MAAGRVTDECAVAVAAERLWKAALADQEHAVLPKACAGYIESVEVEGDGGLGTVTTMRLNPAVGGAAAFRSRLLARDAAARVVRSEVLEGGEVSARLRSQVTEVGVEPAGDGASVLKIAVEYETRDGAPLPPEDQAKLTQGYIGLIKKVEEYLVAHPEEFA